MTEAIGRTTTPTGVQFTFSANLAKKLGDKWIAVINEACSERSTLLGRMGMVYDLDFIYAIIKVAKKYKYVSHRFDCGLLKFIANDNGNEVKYEMHPVDSETRFYGSTQSSIGERYRAMYGDMSKGWYCVKMD